MARELHDHYFRQAKRDGYRSRAAYKLIEIDDKKSLLRKGAAVLDCGAAPGSWLQVAAARVGPKGHVVGIDLQTIDALAESNVTILQGDLRDVEVATLIEPLTNKKRFDVVLSDMAPNTTGDRNSDHHKSVRLCDAVLDRCPDVLAPGGSLAMKVLEGAAYADLLQRTKAMFDHAKGFKPKASRDSSTEMYVIATGFAANSSSEEEDSAKQDIAPAPPRPSTGWGR